MEYAIAKPKDGRRVKDPRDLSVLPASGRRVKVDRYWRRRAKDGDVELLEVKPVAEQPAADKGGSK